MFARVLCRQSLSLARQLCQRRAASYICDASVIQAYQTDPKLKALIDQQQHQFYYHENDKARKQQSPIPTVFKPMSASSSPLDNAWHLVTSVGTSSASHRRPKETSIEEFMETALYNERGHGKFPGMLGLEFLCVRHGYTFSQLKLREELMAPNGYLHAGVVITLADTACGYGCIKSKPAGAKSFTTIELKSNFFSTAKPPVVIECEARMVHGGKTTQVWDANVTNAQTNKLMAMFRCTELIIY